MYNEVWKDQKSKDDFNSQDKATMMFSYYQRGPPTMRCVTQIADCDGLSWPRTYLCITTLDPTPTEELGDTGTWDAFVE